MNILITFLSSLVTFSLLTYLTNGILEIKKNFFVFLISLFVIFNIISALINILTTFEIRIVLLNVCYILYIRLITESNILKVIIFVFFPFILILSISEIFTANFIRIAFYDFLLNKNGLLDFFLGLFFTFIIAFLLISIYQAYFKAFTTISLPAYSWIMLFLPISTILLIYNLKNYNSIFKNNISIFLILVLLLVSNYINIIIFLRSIKYLDLKKRYVMLEKKEIESTARYNLAISQYLNSFKFMHNAREKIFNLSNLIRNNEMQNVEKNFEDINKDILTAMNIINTNSNVLNNIIKENVKLLEKNDIKYFIDLNNINSVTKINQSKLIYDIFLTVMMYYEQQDSDEKYFIIKNRVIGNKIALKLSLGKNETKYDILNDFKERMYSNYKIKVSVLIDKDVSIILILSN